MGTLSEFNPLDPFLGTDQCEKAEFEAYAVLAAHFSCPGHAGAASGVILETVDNGHRIPGKLRDFLDPIHQSNCGHGAFPVDFPNAQAKIADECDVTVSAGISQTLCEARCGHSQADAVDSNRVRRSAAQDILVSPAESSRAGWQSVTTSAIIDEDEMPTIRTHADQFSFEIADEIDRSARSAPRSSKPDAGYRGTTMKACLTSRGTGILPSLPGKPEADRTVPQDHVVTEIAPCTSKGSNLTNSSMGSSDDRSLLRPPESSFRSPKTVQM